MHVYMIPAFKGIEHLKLLHKVPNNTPKVVTLVCMRAPKGTPEGCYT